MIIHRGGMVPPSTDLVRTWCGRRLPYTPRHFDILGYPLPHGARRCKICGRKLQLSEYRNLGLKIKVS
ncbi:MAG: hypothetical protein KGR26_09080 [Cyanobacteria bacterium REEB65]|nr:hypothetical protein [Cyanobacteria bacterium REEB65]